MSDLALFFLLVFAWGWGVIHGWMLHALLIERREFAAMKARDDAFDAGLSAWEGEITSAGSATGEQGEAL